MKKEIAIAACSAVALIILLGIMSYLLFPQVSVQGYTASIDVYTQKGGKGINKTSGNFALNETVVLYAAVKNASNMPAEGLVSFEVLPLNDTAEAFVFVNMTNSLGIASYRFRIPPVNSLTGQWLVYATVSVNNQPLAGTVSFFVTDPPFS